jgi:hypothetical protein
MIVSKGLPMPPRQDLSLDPIAQVLRTARHQTGELGKLLPREFRTLAGKLGKGFQPEKF